MTDLILFPTFLSLFLILPIEWVTALWSEYLKSGSGSYVFFLLFASFAFLDMFQLNP